MGTAKDMVTPQGHGDPTRTQPPGSCPRPPDPCQGSLREGRGEPLGFFPPTQPGPTGLAPSPASGGSQLWGIPPGAPRRRSAEATWCQQHRGPQGISPKLGRVLVPGSGLGEDGFISHGEQSQAPREAPGAAACISMGNATEMPNLELLLTDPLCKRLPGGGDAPGIPEPAERSSAPGLLQKEGSNGQSLPQLAAIRGI